MLACSFALSEFHSINNLENKVILTGKMNITIPKIFKDIHYQNTCPENNTYTFSLVDASEISSFPSFVKVENVIEVYDHYMQHKDYWSEKIKKRSTIEKVGSCATLIWEKYRSNNLSDKISQQSANLLYTSIFSHTLNFLANSTSKRDKLAFKKLSDYISLPNDFVETYFKDVQDQILNNFEEQFWGDFVIRNLPLEGDSSIGQLEIWNAKDLLNKKLTIIKKLLLEKENKLCFANFPSISEKISYIVPGNNYSRDLLLKVLNIKSKNNDFLVTEKLLQRKDIIIAINNKEK